MLFLDNFAGVRSRACWTRCASRIGWVGQAGRALSVQKRQFDGDEPVPLRLMPMSPVIPASADGSTAAPRTGCGSPVPLMDRIDLRIEVPAVTAAR
jgi:hypothetical protein